MREIELSRFAADALVESAPRPLPEDVLLGVALRFYLREREVGGPAWPYPGFLRGAEEGSPAQSLEVDLAGEEWAAFEAEAERQGISASKLAEHAAIYFVAALEAGRVTQRIVDELTVAQP